MANEATAELYTRQSGLNKAKFRTDYEQYLADLATKYGISNEQLNTNLEARGILRSGEAGTARTRLSAAEEAARTSAQSDFDYNVANEDINLATRLAGLMAGGSGGSTPATPATPAIPPADEPAIPTTPVLYRSPTDPAYDDMRNRGPRTPAPAVRPVRDATPRTPAPVTNMPRPGTTPAPASPDLSGVNWNALAGSAGLPSNAAPAVRPVRDATPRTPAPVTNMPRPGTTPAPAPALPDLSGVDFAGLGQMMEANKKPKPVDLSGVNWNALAGFGGGSSTAKPATTRVNPVAARNR